MAKKSQQQAQATPAASTAVVTKKSHQVSQPLDYAIDAGAGFEGAGKEAYAIPFLTILQSGSPQTKKSEGAYIKGAAEGMFYNTVTNEVMSGDEGIEIIPCGFTNTFVEWGLREKGGGFISEYTNEAGRALLSTTKVDDKNRSIMPNGHQLNDHRNHYVLVKDDEDNWQPALISMTSTQIKASRNWMSTMQRICATKNLPMFALKFTVTTTPQKNEKGSWHGYVFEHDGILDDPNVYAVAKAFYQQVKSGGVKAAPREAPPDSTSVEPDDM